MKKIKLTQDRATLKCVVCGSFKRVSFSKFFGDYLCGNHKNHMNRNGHILERTRRTPNEIIIKENYAEMIIYNRKHEEKGRALIDIEDIDLVKNYKWCIDGNGTVGNKKVGKLHRFVLMTKNQNKEVDHWNRNQLDCRKNNLREVSHSLNIHNSKMWKHNKSGTVGVRINSKSGKWEADIKINYKTKHLGLFINKQDAINARKQAEKDFLPIDIYPR